MYAHTSAVLCAAGVLGLMRDAWTVKGGSGQFAKASKLPDSVTSPIVSLNIEVGKFILYFILSLERKGSCSSPNDADPVNRIKECELHM